MKTFKYSLLAAALACGLANAQTAYTTPVGYTTEELTPGFNLVGLTLQSPVSLAGVIDAVNGAELTDNGVDFTATLPAGATYILEIVSGASSGTVQEFITITANTITLPAALPNVAVGDEYKIRVAPTLEEIFGTILQTQATAAGSDIVWVSGGVGVFERYYLNTPFFGSPVWKKINPDNSEVNAPNTPLIYLDGIFVEVKSSAKSLVVSGEVKTDQTNLIVETGFNASGMVYPAGSTLGNSGLALELQSQATAAGSDIVWVPSGAGVFAKYYYNTPFFGSATWKVINADNTESNVDGRRLRRSLRRILIRGHSWDSWAGFAGFDHEWHEWRGGCAALRRIPIRDYS